MTPPTVASQSANGVLPIPAAVLQKQAPPNNAPRGPARKTAAPRLKVVVRRLPPGLTQAEFETALGEEWRGSGGKIDWLMYKPGKVSKDLAKPSRPSRAYLHLTDQSHLKFLSEKIQQSGLIDAKNTSKDAALIGPPSLEFAPYPRIPSGRKRNDARQGTIDQDPEFIEFLQSLTNPISKPSVVDAEASSKKEEVKTTPLIEHLREKKAAKEKPTTAKASGKHGRQESKEAKASEKGDKKATKGAAPSPEKGKKLTKAEKAAREAVKVLNREASAQATDKPAPGTAAAERKRDRAVPPINIAAKIQRDLGLAPAAGGRRGKRESTPETQSSAAESSRDSTPAPTGPAQTSTVSPKKDPRTPRGRRSSKSALSEKTNVEPAAEASKKIPTGPAQPTILKKAPGTPQAQTPKGPAAPRTTPLHGPKAPNIPTGPSATQADPTPTPSSPVTPSAAIVARQAFLKHANPSQGITEPLIEEALTVFGAIEKVEIDRKKGFAYVEFADSEGLRKAITASPVKVAQGAVQVLERRDRPAGRQPPVAPMQMQRGGFRGGRGGRGRGGGRGGIGGAPISPSVQAASPVAAPSTPAAPATSKPET